MRLANHNWEQPESRSRGQRNIHFATLLEEPSAERLLILYVQFRQIVAPASTVKADAEAGWCTPGVSGATLSAP